MSTTTTLANLCEDLSDTLKEFALTARALRDREADLPATMSVRHVSKYEGWAPSTTWRKAKLGQLDGIISAPGEPLRFDRDTYLAGRRKRREQAA